MKQIVKERETESYIETKTVSNRDITFERGVLVCEKILRIVENSGKIFF